MIKPKTFKQPKHCYYLATQIAEALLLSASDVGFEFVSASIINGLLDARLQRGIDHDIDSALALFPHKDNNPSITETVKHNALFLCQLFKLDIGMKPVIELIIVLNVNAGLQALLEALSDHDENILIDELEQNTGLSQEKIQLQLQLLTDNRLIDDAQLRSPYLLTLPAPYRALFVDEKLTSRDTFLKPILKYSPPSQFSLKQFEHVNADLVCRYLNAATKQQLKGVNILFYGAAGTGKTELSRTLAKVLRRGLLEIPSVQIEDGRITDDFLCKSPASQRLTYLNLMQSLLDGSDKNLLLVDECESVFTHADEHYSKEGLMRLLENNPVPAIWITNHISMLEPSYIRRFKLVIEIPVPDESFSYAMNSSILQPLKVSDAFRLTLASKTKAAPAFIANAVHVAQALSLTGDEAEMVVLDVVEATLDACGEETQSAKYKGQLNFDPNLLNFNASCGSNAQTIVTDLDNAIANSLPVRVLLSGPPGTGKTSWVHHLAETHGMEIMHIKCSDILGMYVGESEQNIAALFREAHSGKKLMLFDEVDSVLNKRENSQAQHQVQLINELLSQIECNSMPVFAATNMLSSIDSAVMRRFDFKLTCDYLTQTQSNILYRQVLGLKKITQYETNQLSMLQQLTPGDFAILARRMLFQPNHNHRDTAISLLTAENDRKKTTRRIGFN